MDAPHDLAAWLEVLSVAGGFAGWGCTFVVWLVKSSLVTRRDLSDALEETGKQLDANARDIASADTRISTLTNELKHFPTHQDLRELTQKLNTVQNDVTGLATRLAGIRDISDRIERQLNVLLDARIKEGT